MSLRAANAYQKAFILCLCIVVFACALFKFPTDDGLRHIGLAFSKLTSWGDVYPYSRFEQFGDYNPWYGYDKLLYWASRLLKQLPIPLLATKLILTKILALLFGAIFFYLVLSKSGLFKKIEDPHSLTLAVILIVAFLALAFIRSLSLRPFIIGTFFLLYSIRQRGMSRGIISATALSFFYPYLSWYYIVPVSFAHVIKGDKKFALGLILFIIPFLLWQPESFWGFQAALFESDRVRSAITLKIAEFNPTITYWHFFFFLAGLAIIYPRLSDKCRRLNYTNLLVLFYLVPAFKYIRYFEDLLCPLLFVGYGSEIFKILLPPYIRTVQSWKEIVLDKFNRIKIVKNRILPVTRKQKTRPYPKPGKKLWPLITVLYIFLGILMVQFIYHQFAQLKSLRQDLSPVPRRAIILHTFNLQYRILFLRPDLRLVPSCEMGFAAKNVMPEYLQFMNRGLVTPLAKKIGAKYFLESKKLYIHPKEGKSLELINENSNLSLWRIMG